MASGRDFVCLGRGPCLKVQMVCLSSGGPAARRTPACPLWSSLGWDVPGHVDILTGLRPISVNTEFRAKRFTWIVIETMSNTSTTAFLIYFLFNILKTVHTEDHSNSSNISFV